MTATEARTLAADPVAQLLHRTLDRIRKFASKGCQMEIVESRCKDDVAVTEAVAAKLKELGYDVTVFEGDRSSEYGRAWWHRLIVRW